MLFYLESCESGSMFKGLLPDDINVYATTAANPKESSYACYYDSHLETYLGDLYSVNWMENSDIANLNAETLQKQFELVKAKTNLSHVQEYGYMSIGKEPVANFLGSKAKDSIVEYPTVPFDAVSVDDVDLFILNQKIDKASEDKKPELSAQLHYTLLVLVYYNISSWHLYIDYYAFAS
ncbi:LGMN [Bugula neritina]|uniref:LGMN n=1 Tax=Bugula neritina TaxID=10212 RepID=A0A7J7ITG8_BUGNE|nr:LGMN [Bugula neritina]